MQALEHPDNKTWLVYYRGGWLANSRVRAPDYEHAIIAAYVGLSVDHAEMIDVGLEDDEWENLPGYAATCGIVAWHPTSKARRYVRFVDSHRGDIVDTLVAKARAQFPVCLIFAERMTPRELKLGNQRR